MTTIQQAITTSILVTADKIKNETSLPTTAVTHKASWLERDIVLNVGFAESMIRGLVSIFIPWPIMFINPLWMIYMAPLMFYFFVTGLVHFCPIRYAWRHWVKHIPDPLICDFAIDLNIPVKII